MRRKAIVFLRVSISASHSEPRAHVLRPLAFPPLWVAHTSRPTLRFTDGRERTAAPTDPHCGADNGGLLSAAQWPHGTGTNVFNHYLNLKWISDVSAASLTLTRAGTVDALTTARNLREVARTQGVYLSRTIGQCYSKTPLLLWFLWMKFFQNWKRRRCRGRADSSVPTF